jgi:hypothetical protein
MPNWFSKQRVPASALMDACLKGKASLHGAGVHPSHISERVAMPMARSLTKVDYVRIIESVNFIEAPEGMWGGLNMLGFGQKLDSLTLESSVIIGGDLCYADTVGNIAHTLYGVPMSEVRMEKEIKGIPAEEDIQIGALTIKAGTVYAIHFKHHGYIGDHHFATNEECWYLSWDKEKGYRGENLPFGNYSTPISYTIEIEGTPGNIRCQMEYEIQEGIDNPITNASVQSLLNAVGPVCAAEPGILIDDPQPYYCLDDRIHK